MMAHVTLYVVDTSEQKMLFKHLNLLRTDDMVVIDRGYITS
jgi:hypothetical protein